MAEVHRRQPQGVFGPAEVQFALVELHAHLQHVVLRLDAVSAGTLHRAQQFGEQSAVAFRHPADLPRAHHAGVGPRRLDDHFGFRQAAVFGGQRAADPCHAVARGYAVFVQYGQRAARDVEPSVRGGVKPDARGRERGKEVSLHAPQVELRRLRLPFGRRESLVVLLRQTQAGVEGERFGLGVCAAAEQCREDDGKSFHRSIRILKNMA